MIRKLIAIIFLLGCLLGFVVHAMWTINASHAWIGFFSMVWSAMGVYVSWNVIKK